MSSLLNINSQKLIIIIYDKIIPTTLGTSISSNKTMTLLEHQEACASRT